MGSQDLHNLKVVGKEPLNAEPDLAALIQHSYTPTELIYCRNHSTIPNVDAQTFTIKVDGLVEKELELSLKDLKHTFPRTEVVAALQCAGNRRQKMVDKKQKDVQGIKWNEAIISNIKWAGVRLVDVLCHAQVLDRSGAMHVCFASNTVECQDDKWYGGSIPLDKAISADGGVLIAYEMNGRPLTPSHGFPLRIVVPGYSGARWVKWVDRITVSADESPNFYQQRDYKVLPPQVESYAMADSEGWWSRVPALQANPVSSVIATAKRTHPATSTAPTQFLIKGYAIAGPDARIATVELSTNGGSTWVPARIAYQEGPWSWALWEGEVLGQGSGVVRVLSRATDEAGVSQPQDCEWNLRGVGYSAVGEVDIEL